MTKLIALKDRGIIKVAGPDAIGFLNNLITNNMELLNKEKAIFAGLLTPQGKIAYEFFVVRVGDTYLLELVGTALSDLMKKLMLYKLRANVSLEDASNLYEIFSLGGGEIEASLINSVVFKDPRSDAMGWRVYLPKGETLNIEGLESGSFGDYDRLRLSAEMPEGGVDYPLGDCFPHEAAFDQLEAIDFKKGCYVGQEVVSRMEHRGTARKRIVRIIGGGELPATGSEIRSENSLIGVLGTSCGADGLALVRLDRVAKALSNGDQIMVENVTVEVAMPSWAEYNIPEIS